MGGRKEKPKKLVSISPYYLLYKASHIFLLASLHKESIWECLELLCFKNLTIIALKLNHLYVLQDQMVKVGVCLQALCIRFFSCFLVQSWIFQLTKKAMRNETRLISQIPGLLDFTPPSSCTPVQGRV